MSLIDEEERKKLSELDIKKLKKIIKERREGLSETTIEVMAYHVRSSLREDRFWTLTDPKLTVEEKAERLGLSVKTVRRYMYSLAAIGAIEPRRYKEEPDERFPSTDEILNMPTMITERGDYYLRLGLIFDFGVEDVIPFMILNYLRSKKVATIEEISKEINISTYGVWKTIKRLHKSGDVYVPKLIDKDMREIFKLLNECVERGKYKLNEADLMSIVLKPFLSELQEKFLRELMRHIEDPFYIPKPIGKKLYSEAREKYKNYSSQLQACGAVIPYGERPNRKFVIDERNLPILEE